MKKLILTTASVLVLAACNNARAEEYTVKMVTNLDAEQVYYFEPAELTIQPGDTIKWVNVQEDMHNAVADAGPKGAELFESPMLEEEGANWSFTFGDVQGTYSYHCHPHAAAGMKGMIIVGQASVPEDMEGATGHGDHDHDSGNAKGQECEAGMDCPVHEDMKHGGKGGHMMGEEMHEGMTDKKVSDDGHDNHEH